MGVKGLQGKWSTLSCGHTRKDLGIRGPPRQSFYFDVERFAHGGMEVYHNWFCLAGGGCLSNLPRFAVKWRRRSIAMKQVRITCISILFVLLLKALPLSAQEVPKDYQEVLTFLGRSGDFKAKALKVNVPRSDLHVTIAGQSTPTPFGFGGWVAMTKGDGGAEVLDRKSTRLNSS